MSRIFISHSGKNDDWAIALKDWLVRAGWSRPDDIFLDLDPERGIAAGQRWVAALEEAATRCEAVLFLVSEDWLASKWCADEYQLASKFNKKLFALLIGNIALDRLPGGLTAQWQVVRLTGEPAERFVAVHPVTGKPSPVHISSAGLMSLKRGLVKAGLGPDTFELQPDQNSPFGWRAPYRGLEALEPEDAAVFFGRNADIVHGIDALRGLAARRPPRLFVILGASGAGKSSFLRAGLWPRLLRDDSQWLPLRAIRASRGGAIEGTEGLLAALEDVHARFALRANRADLRERLATVDAFVALLTLLREAAARRALISEPPYPVPVISFDQGEELFAAGAPAESGKLLALARAAIDRDTAILVVGIRSDSYGTMQGAKILAGIDQVLLSLGPVPHGEIAHVIRDPAEILRRKAGPDAPLFDAAVIERLQQEIEGEKDALPLLAFVLQRLMREHQGTATIGITELERTGGVAAAIEQAAEAALDDAGVGPDRVQQRGALRRLFIPHLARIDHNTKAPVRRVAWKSELPTDLLPLARALTDRRLLVAKVARQAESGVAEDAATLEVAHEALLRRWPVLAELLSQDRDALLLLDSVLSAAADWEKASAPSKRDFLVHRGSRLSDAQALASRGPHWDREMAAATAYLAACAAHETAEREEKEAAQAAITQSQVNLLAFAGDRERELGKLLTALRFCVHAAREALRHRTDSARAGAALAAAVCASDWQLLLAGHEHDLMSAAFSPDGMYIVTASLDMTARIWDAFSGQEMRVLRGHDGWVRSAAFSPEGRRIVTTALDMTARIWNASSGQEIRLLRGHERDLVSARFSPEGTRIVTASLDKTARIWDASNGQEIRALRGHEDDVVSAAFSPEGTRIATTSRDNTARIWDASSGQEIRVLRGHENWVRSAAFSPDGERIVTASRDRTARIWDVSSGQEICVLRGHEDPVMSAAFSPDGMRIVTASFDRTARVWTAYSGQEICVLRGHEDHLFSAVFNPDGTRIVTASKDKTGRIWDAHSRQEIRVLPVHKFDVGKVAFNPDRTRIVTAARICDASSGQEIRVLQGHERIMRSAAFSPDGNRIVTVSLEGPARIWDASSGQELRVLRGHEDLLVSAEFSIEGGCIVTTSFDKTARIWAASSGQEMRVLRGHEAAVRSAAFSPDGRRIVTASDDKTARIWDTSSGQEICVLRGHEDRVFSAAFNPEGTRIVTTSLDKTARIWDASSGQEIRVLRGHEDNVMSAAFSPDGRRIVTASDDKTARIWDASNGQEICVLRGHEDKVVSAAFSADGTRIVTTSSDKTERIWDVHLATMSTEGLIVEVCRRRLLGMTKLSREEMRLAGYADTMPQIDVAEKLE